MLHKSRWTRTGKAVFNPPITPINTTASAHRNRLVANWHLIDIGLIIAIIDSREVLLLQQVPLVH